MYFLSMEMIQIRTEIRGMWFPEKPSLEKSSIAELWEKMILKTSNHDLVAFCSAANIVLITGDFEGKHETLTVLQPRFATPTVNPIKRNYVLKND